MAANNDFFISFGSNAKTFAAQLITELKPARKEIAELQGLLTTLETKAKESKAEFRQAIATSAEADSKRTSTGGSRGEGDAATRGTITKFNDALEAATSDLQTMQRQLNTLMLSLGRTIPGIEAFVKKANQSRGQTVTRVENGNYNHRNSGSGRFAGATDPGAVVDLPGLNLSAQQLRQLNQIRTSGGLGGTSTTPSTVTISNVSKLQLDQAGFDRVVTALHEVRDEVRKIGTRPSAQRQAGQGAVADTPAPPSTTPSAPATTTPTAAKDKSKGKGKGKDKAEEVSDADLATQEARLKEKLARNEAKIARVNALLAASGKAVDEAFDGLGDELDSLAQTRSDIKAEIAKLEREQGATKAEQKARRKEEFASAPDLNEKQYDERVRMRQRLDMALDPKEFREQIGRGKGQLSKEDLIGMATQLGKLGFDTRATERMSKPEIAENIISSRQAMFEKFGTSIPEELRTGRKLVEDKVSKSVRDLLARVNISAAEAAEEEAAREVKRVAYQSGNLPPDVMEREAAAGSMLTVQRPAGVEGQGPWRVHTGMGNNVINTVPDERQPIVKGGSYHDAYGFLDAVAMVEGRALGRAAGLARNDPTFDPRAMNIDDEIQGHGEKAQEARRAFFAIRRATDDLDDLGREFVTFEKAIERNRKFIDAAERRLNMAAAGKKLQDHEVKKLGTDPDAIIDAREQIEKLERLMQSDRYKGVQDVLEEPDYRAGLEARDVTRAHEEALRLNRAARERETYINDAAGQSLIGTRHAIGTKDTIIRNISGARFETGKNRGAYGRFGFTDPDKDFTQLAEMNQAWTSTQAGLRRERNIAADIARGAAPKEDLDKERAKTENSATRFLNQMQEIFGISTPILEVLGREAQSAGNITMEAERRKASGDNILTGPTSGGADKMELLGRRVEMADKANADLVQADKALAAAKAKVAALEEEHAGRIQAHIESLDAGTRAAYDAAKAEQELARTEAKAIGNTQRSAAAEAKEMSAVLAAENKVAKTRKTFDEARGGKGDVVSTRAEWEEAKRELDLLARRIHEEGVARDRNQQQLRAAYARENAARQKVADILGDVNKEVREAQAAEKVASKAKGAAQAEYNRIVEGTNTGVGLKSRGFLGMEESFGEGGLRGLMVTQAEARVEARNAKIRELERIGAPEADVDQAVEARRAAMRDAAELSTMSGPDLLDRLRAEVQAAAEKKAAKAGDGAGGAKEGAPSAADRKKADSAERRELQARIKAAEDIHDQIKELQKKKDAANREEKAAINAQLKALRDDPAFLPKKGENSLKTLRQERWRLDKEAAAAGGGAGDGTPPPPRTGGGRGGSGGFDPESNNILRDILTAVNGIHKTLQTRVRTRSVTVDEDGKPVERQRKSRVSPRVALESELKMAESGDADQIALAAIEQERRRKEMERTGMRSHINAMQGQAVKEDARLQREGAEAARRGGMITRAQARAKLDLANATAQLNEEAKRELTELRRLSAAGAANEKIVAQQARAYAAMDNAMRGGGVPANDRRFYAQTLLSDANVRPNPRKPGETMQGPAINRPELDAIARSARDVQGYVADTTQQMAGYIGEDSQWGRALQAMFGGNGFWARIMASTGTFVVRNFTAGAVFGITNALQDVIAQAILTEATFVRVSHALEATGQDVGSLRSDLQGISTVYGTALNDVYEVAAGLTGLFDNTEDLAMAAEVVSQLEMISMGALTAKEAMGALASIQGAFASELGTGVDGLQHVADVLTSVQNNTGTNVEVTAEAVGRMSGLAAQLGLSYEEVAVYGAQIAKLTNQTGAAAGEQFSRMISVVQTGRGRSAIGEAFGNVDGRETGIEGMLSNRNYSGALRVMQEEWDNLTRAQQDNVATTIGGQRQAAAFAALMRNGEKTLNAITKAQYSHGDALDRTKALMNTLNKQIDVLGTNFQNLANNLVRTGILNFLGLLLKTTNFVLNGINSVMSTVNDFADSNPLLKWIKEVGFGIVGMVLAVSLLARSFRGLKATLNGLPSVQRFREAAAPNREGERTMGQAVRERVGVVGAAANNALGVVTSANNEVRQVQGGVLSRTVAANMDRFLVQPMKWTGDQVSRFGGLLQEHARIAAVNATQERSLHQSMAQTQRAVAVDRVGGVTTGVGGAIASFAGGASDTLRGRTTVRDRLGNLSQGLQLRQQDFRIASETAERAGRDRQSKSYGALSRTAGLAARSTDRVAAGMNRIAGSGIGADAAMMAVTMGITAMITAAADAAADAEANADVMRARWEKNKSGGRGKNDEPEYFGPGDELYAERTKDFTEEGSTFMSGLKFGGNILADTFSGAGGILTGGLLGDAGDINNMFTGETIDRLTGSTGGIFGDKETYGRTDVQKQYDAAMKKLAEAADAGATSEELLKIQEDFENELAENVAEVDENSALSEKQRLGYKALADQASAGIQEQAEDLVAISEGLTSAGLLTSDQLARISDFTGATGALQGQRNLMTDFESGLMAMMGETGVDENNPELQAALGNLMAGGMDSAEAAANQSAVIREQAKQAEVSYLGALRRGDNAEGQIDDARGLFIQLMGQLASQTEQQIQMFVQIATSLADEAAHLGNFDEARSALEQGIADLESQRISPTYDPETGRPVPLTAADEQFNRGLDTQQRGLNTSIWEQEAQEQNRSLAMQNARGQGEAASARNNLQQQRNVLRTMKQARDENAKLGPSAEQIHQQQLAVAQAKHQLGQAMASRDVTAAMLAAAGIWNQAQAAAAAEQVAGMQVQEAIEEFGRGSVEHMQAQINQINAGMATTRALDAEAMAAAETGAARIGQGDALGQAAAQRNIAALAVSQAAKFGTTSVEYQSAIQQQIAAQNAFVSAQFAVQQANAALAGAIASARGNTVAAARAAANGARVALAEARALSGGTRSADVINAEAALVSQHAAIGDAIQQRAVDRAGVAVALAEAAGHTVRAARLSLRQAQIALRHSRGDERFAARAAVIQARAAARDAALQDRLDTIDFNLQMGKITQSSAIAALREILRTRNLTKEQRRQLLLQIKGMKDEIAGDATWNFGDIDLPAPYQMRRYIQQRRRALQAGVDAGLGVKEARQVMNEGRYEYRAASENPNARAAAPAHVENHNVQIQIDGADIGKVKQIIRDVVGGRVDVRTSQPRRR